MAATKKGNARGGATRTRALAESDQPRLIFTVASRTADCRYPPNGLYRRPASSHSTEAMLATTNTQHATAHAAPKSTANSGIAAPSEAHTEPGTPYRTTARRYTGRW
jgi:hypothetical protein